MLKYFIMSELIRPDKNVPTAFVVEGSLVNPPKKHTVAHHGHNGVAPYNTPQESPQENLQGLLAQPLSNGHRPYKVILKAGGILKPTFKHTAQLVEDYPTAVPSDNGGLQKATLLERAVYAPTTEWGFRDNVHSIFAGLPNHGLWEMPSSNIGSLSSEPAVMVERAKLSNDEIVATITPGQANLRREVFLPRATYSITALGGVTLRDWGREGLSGVAQHGRPRSLREKEVAEFVTNMRWLADPERYEPRSPYHNMRTATDVNERNNSFTALPKAAAVNGVTWFPADKPDQFTYKT
jgi:hypothetical protein